MHYLWMLNEKIGLKTDLLESVTKISSINNHIFILTINNNLLQGFVNTKDNKKYVKLQLVENLKLLDISSCKDCLYIVTTEGLAYRCNEDLELLNEICLFDEYKCGKGHNAIKYKTKIKNISAGEYGQLFVTEQGQLWGCGFMPQIGINTEVPQKVQFFAGRTVHSMDVGNDFAIAIVNKQNKIDACESEVEEIFIQHCPRCISASQLTSSGSPNSISDICPLGVKVQCSYDIETTSTSSKNDSTSSLSDNNENCDAAEDKTERNIIFRNTEAAKEFLTRQISRMSSVGEEYLVECAEKPTRIIKENVSNVASLVYEGVKTVGDKVATLSRHVSGSSDCNSIVENNGVKKEGSKDGFELSVSQCTSEKDLSEHGIGERANAVVNTGTNLLSREVWTWGNIIHGQLGIGDNIKRERPMIISKLSSIGVSKVSVQSCHAAVLTIDGRGYIWGQNDHNQVTLENNVDQSSPKLFATKSDERIKDIVCGSHFTLVLTTNKEALYFGKGSKIVLPLDISENAEDSRKIALFKYLISSNQYCLLNEVLDKNDDILGFLVDEQKMLEEMLLVQLYLIKPLQKKVGDSPTAFEDLCRYYTELLYFWAANIQSMIEYSNGLICDSDIVIFKHFEEHIYVYKNYITTVQNVVSIDGFKSISKLIEISPILFKLRPDICNKKEKNDEQIVTTFLTSPVNRIDNFTNIIELFHAKNKDVVNKWSGLVETYHMEQAEAEKTKEFWQSIGKSIDYVKSPNRRLIYDSQKHPINLHNSSRFSYHWFVLFNDLFAHINGSSSYLYNLTMIWVEPQQDENSQYHQMILRTPEEMLTLSSIEPEAKIEWFHMLQQAIKLALNKPDALQPPLLRSGSYTFTKTGLRDAKYTGRWLNAKMHGTGKLEWSDGKTYVGHFVNNQMCGYGTMETPGVGRYEGEWKDNQQNGIGTFIYANTDVYKGHFKDGLPHGHGCLRKGNFMANAASLYIGEWVSGAKSGYGVMDDIVTGEKYIGTWSDNKRQGNGLIVTSEGIYYEGMFTQDVLTGQGIMILDDGTHYEGEFKGTGILNGKGVLTLPSGQKIEGNLTGCWHEGIKINGTFMKNSDSQNSLPKSFEQLCTPANQKWRALFKHCHQVLGIPDTENANKNGVKTIDTQKIWQNVAVYLSNATTIKRSKGEIRLQNSLNRLDIIPPFGRDKVDLKAYEEIKSYLSKAFESNIHPLGSLLNNIAEAYTTTYSGKAHPLLLPHAITELIDVTKRLYEIVTFLFPALPPYGKSTFLNSDSCDEVITYQSLLYPILLPKVHNPLFTLLALKNKKEERHYKKTLKEWNKQPDPNLMAFLSVDQKFCDQQNSSPTTDFIFIDAIETLQQIKSMFSPTEKLMVIKDTIEKMTEVAQILLGQNYIWNMDDLFPLFLYVVVRARIPELGSELEFIDKFMDPNLENGELGIMFTTLKACYQQILQEKSSF